MGRVGAVRILVVDDHRGFRESFVSFLKQIPAVEIAGQAADGQEAEEMAIKLSPDLVIMEIKMPRCDGVVAARRIKHRRPSVRVILYSMYDPGVAECPALKVDRFIPKQRLCEEILPELQGKSGEPVSYEDRRK